MKYEIHNLFKNFSDILWSDPFSEEAGKMESIFKINDVRGCSFFFGFFSIFFSFYFFIIFRYDAIKHFLDKNDLISLIRAHEAQYDGLVKFNLLNIIFNKV